MSSLCVVGPPFEGTIFLKKMFCDTKMIADPNAQMRPIMLDADVSKLHASITPTVKGSNEKYVLGEYFTPNSSA